MDDLRFDGLARAMAAQPSRRRIAGFLVGSVVGGVLGARGWGQAARVLADGEPPVETSPENSAQGRCDKLDDLIRRGVKGTGKQPYAGLAGATEPGLSVGWDNYQIKFKRKGGKICASATVTFRPKANPRSFRLDWTPEDAADPAGCAAEVQDWINRVEQHERDHYRAAEGIATGHQQSRPFSACGRDRDGARDALKEKVGKARDEIQADQLADWDQHLKDYHNEHGETTPPPDCRKCCPNGTCCPPTPKPCEGQCCAEHDQCCGGQCCPQGRQCCGGSCCPAGQQCCDGTCRTSCTCLAGDSCGTKIYCRCNHTCYDSAVDCTNHCHASLGCFTDICRPAQAGEC